MPGWLTWLAGAWVPAVVKYKVCVVYNIWVRYRAWLVYIVLGVHNVELCARAC